MPRSAVRILGNLQKEREEADYERGTSYAAEDADEAREAAREFRETVASLLRAEGWME